MTNLRKQVVVPSAPSYSLIPLTRGFIAIVDSADYDWLNQWKWCATPQGYAVRRIRVRGRYRILGMHNLILDTPKKKRGDHWNGDVRDNRRCNLRVVSIRKNTQNCRVSRNNSSGCTGVSWAKSFRKWHVYITPLGGRRKTLGHFDKLDEAIAVRKDAEKKYYGEVIRSGCPARIILTPAIIKSLVRGKRVNNSSGITGVSRHRGTGKWMARVFTGKTTHYLGLYPSKRLAALAIKNFWSQRAKV